MQVRGRRSENGERDILVRDIKDKGTRKTALKQKKLKLLLYEVKQMRECGTGAYSERPHSEVLNIDKRINITTESFPICCIGWGADKNSSLGLLYLYSLI